MERSLEHAGGNDKEIAGRGLAQQENTDRMSLGDLRTSRLAQLGRDRKDIKLTSTKNS